MHTIVSHIGLVRSTHQHWPSCGLGTLAEIDCNASKDEVLERESGSIATLKMG